MEKPYLKWLLEVADRRPLLFSIAILLLAVIGLTTMVAERDKRLDRYMDERMKLDNRCNDRIDSVSRYYSRRDEEKQARLDSVVTSIVNEYKADLEEQKKTSDKVKSTINENKKIIKSLKTRR